jgi:adenine deaminase
MRNHQIAKGELKAELVLKNCNIIDVFNHRIEVNDIAINDGVIVGIGSYDGEKEIDMTNRYVSPGFIDGHVHIESSMLTPSEFSKIVIPKGTVRVVSDPHEIANVLGVKGIGFMFRSSTDTPLKVHIMVPSCVPATQYENSGATISNEDIYSLKDREGILGLGEVMDYPSVINAEKGMMDKLVVMQDKIIDGHAPHVSGKELNAYLLNNIKTDHECTNVEEMNEKISRGMYIHLREGSVTKNVLDLIGGITKENHNRLLFCTDDKHPMDIIEEGHINFNINLAIKNGIDPITAIKMATINIATCYELRQTGAIAPGYKADLVVFDDLTNIQVDEVFIDGKLVAKNNEVLFETDKYENVHVLDSVKLNVRDVDLTLRLKDDYVKVIQLIKNNVTTKKVMRNVNVEHGVYVNNPKDDILKIAVIERHHYTGNIGIGLLEGYGIKNAAVAMTVAHDSHNLIVVGDNDADMLVAVEEIYNLQGGLVIVSNGKVIESLQLEIAGLMTNHPISYIDEKLQKLEKAAHKLGVSEDVDDPFLSLAFMSLPVIPEIKITDKYLFDVVSFKPVSIEGDD